MNASGQVVFCATTSLGVMGIFIGAPGTAPLKVVATGDAYSGGGTFSSLSNGPSSFNDGGAVVFPATLTGGAGGGLFVASSSTAPAAIALHGAASPAGGVYALSSSSIDARINGQGDVLFRTALTGGSSDSALFVRRGLTGLTEVVATQGQAGPGAIAADRSGPSRRSGPTLDGVPGEYYYLGPTGEIVFRTGLDVSGYYVTACSATGATPCLRP